MDIREIIQSLSLEEKASLCSGLNAWNTKPIERLGIPSITVCDGPHGLRKQPGSGDLLGMNVSLPATCFPVASATACSWDPELLRQIGVALGEECLQEQVAILLGPGVNIKRNPLCGRNFEYFSEDPLLAGTLASAFIEGLQSQGIGACIKHFATNNQETRRMTVNALVDERALREIYLPAFERAVKQARPWTVMAAYNRLNGVYCSENEILLTTILREEWGFEGVVISDWGACNDRVAGLRTGLELEMPGGAQENEQAIVEAVRSGLLPQAVLDEGVERLLKLIRRAQNYPRPGYRYDPEAHHHLARRAAAESAVLLKNDGAILPLTLPGKLAVIGSFAQKMRYQGSGSSMVNPLRLEQPLEALRALGGTVSYAPGYQRFSETKDEELLAEACQVAQEAEKVVVFLGLPELAESEGFDREHMRLPANQNELIERLAGIRDDLIVVLFGGSPVEMPWIGKVRAILHMYLPGQAGGSALVDLLFGKANPSGKLAETYPLRYEDTASSRHFPGSRDRVEYRESIFVGYRYFDAARQEVLFPFGHGLSYTSFAYQDLTLSAAGLNDQETLQVALTLTNTGPYAGAEIVQLYIHQVTQAMFKAEKELKGFQKVWLQPGESKRLVFSLGQRDFARYDVTTADWVVEGGEFELLVGASSRDIRFREKVVLHSSWSGKETTPLALGDYTRLATNKGAISAQSFQALFGSAYQRLSCVSKKQYDLNSTLNDLQATLFGKLLRRVLLGVALKRVREDEPERELVARKMVEEAVTNMPLRGLATSSGGILTLEMVEGFSMLANGQFLRGCRKVLVSLWGKWARKGD